MKTNNYFRKILKLVSVCICFCFCAAYVCAKPPETKKRKRAGLTWVCSDSKGTKKCKTKTKTRILSHDIPTNFDGTSDKDNAFFSFISRLRHIHRWSLFKNVEKENLAEHSAEVAFLAHILAVIKNKKYGGKVNTERVTLLALYHDAPELITGDMPSSVKYYGTEMKPLYDKIEKVAVNEMISMLPEEFKDDFKPLLSHTEEEKELWQIVKNADVLAALIKCLREKRLGNPDFNEPLNTISEKVKIMSNQYSEVNYFVKVFMPAFGFKL